MAEVTVAMTEVTLSRLVEVAMAMVEVSQQSRATGCHLHKWHIQWGFNLRCLNGLLYPLAYSAFESFFQSIELWEPLLLF